ncbi:signal recognition particle 54kDa protein 2, putative [Theileria equi strain WA]|uniref:Signal recognition particle 54 kDa protein n=1 Tax=Theileria equi strain WA TaxID=1537102 RepID=L1LFD1_THEEQ|nr:signal recognition particle 54kDa protein 2, putative [Theileria equi strain WA]EKX73960.1 signal recognition particle 54kDa protein 2, putative [Theileria equi strain WA]|eukprot:XP_004833412.1 signal recognition particle 54kDa protein 2, putative [Theileria equi strain WA]
MVLAELSTQITQAFRKLHATTVISEAVIEEVIGDIVRALLLADVNVKLVHKLRENVKRLNKNNADMIGANKRRYLQKIVVDELVSMLTTEKKPFEPKKGRPNVIMFVGLQGAGKTTSCTKFAYHYQRKGWRTALICADTFRAGAFDQLKQNAAKVKISFFGSYSEANPAKVAADGVARFKAEKYDMIIVDTSGRHKQEDALFEEMKLIHDAVQPDEVIFVMDSHIGQACYDQAAAFNKAVDVGSVIITKLDGHAKGGGALSAVAATNSPIIFIGTGEHFDDFEQFEAKSFISRLLGFGDINGLVNTLKDVMNLDEKPDLMERLVNAKFTIRDMYDQFQSLLKMGPVGKVMSMLPGIPPELLAAGREQEGVARIKRFMIIMDSMTDEELDCIKPVTESRVLRIAKGSGSHPAEVVMLVDQHKLLQKMVGGMGKMGLTKDTAMQNMLRNPNQMLSKMQNFLDPRLLQQMGGPGTIMKLMKEFSQNDELGAFMKQGFKR